ncbi:hypothetical protein BTJ45_05280 [Bacillus mycoides]|nr:hypothetical protein BTJ45_05280 [Bacillus mycoides]
MVFSMVSKVFSFKDMIYTSLRITVVFLLFLYNQILFIGIATHRYQL